ncbi:hypothetical protein KVR01_003022 [Diaporthe batatas]|uniref:uncharacterized protein n=1 Tax=Diaporthe batatas TaxID=748121 RepID=UPI001D05B3FE|nr:uncharacterized protein KVR01_003022 [Diaporthe batatas]KAG8167333.1 hypothetical protein KVR01_003022 [Diaporthe batatas]
METPGVYQPLKAWHTSFSKSPGRGASSENDSGAWEAERQVLLDENQELKNRLAEAEAALAQTQEELAEQDQKAADVIADDKRTIEELQESLNASQDRIDKLHVDKARYLRRATEAEEKAAELENHVRILQCRQPWTSTAGATSSGRRDPSPSRNDAPLSRQVEASAAAPGQARSAAPPARVPSRLVFVGTTAPGEMAVHAWHRGYTGHTGRIPWPNEDELLLVRLILEVGPRDKPPRYSKIAKEWAEKFPDRIPRDQGQLKDKAWNIKAFILKNRLFLPPKFDDIGIKDKVRKELISAGINPDRREDDMVVEVDEDGKQKMYLTNVLLV